MITIHSSSRYKVNKKSLSHFAQGILNAYQPGPLAVLTLVFIGTRKMRAIANEYKKEDVALPVLSFSYLSDRTSTDNVIGEVVICYPQAVLLAAERNKKVEDMLHQLIEHGIQNIFSR